MRNTSGFQSETSPWRTARTFAFLFVFITNFLSFPARSEDSSHGWSISLTALDWSSDQAAVDSSRKISERCVNALGVYPCIYKSVEVCRKDYADGKDNQFAVNQCTGFAASAWEGILADVYERLMKSGAAPEDMAKSQAVWKTWNDLDCRAVAGYIGTRSAMDYGNCRLRHAAHRVFDLVQLIPN